jgi:DNA-binding response OmpR family regulator
MQILVADPDERIAALICDALRELASRIDCVVDGSVAAKRLADSSYSLCVFDLLLPNSGGIELIRRIRSERNDVPVLIVSSRGAARDKVDAIDAGADDYVVKPFDNHELVSRCRALVRRSQRTMSESIRWRNLEVNCEARTIDSSGVPLQLTPSEWIIFTHLIRHMGVVQRRSQLEEILYGWAGWYDSNSVEVHIANLRKKLGVNAIRTVRGSGYVIDAV